MLKRKNKLLLNSYYFPPAGTVASIRPYAFYEYFQLHFDDVHVLTSKEESSGDTHEKSHKLSLHNISRTSGMGIRSLLKSENKGGGYGRKSIVPWRIQVFMGRILRTFPFCLFVGEGDLVYIIRQYRKGCQLVQNEGITHLISTYGPWSSILVGYLIAKKFPDLYWIADFRDLPHDGGPYSPFFSSVQKMILKTALTNANLITTVSEGLATQLDFAGAQVKVIYNGIHQREIRAEKPLPCDHFILFYAGTYYPNVNDGSLFELLTDFITGKKVRLKYMGNNPQIWKKRIEKYQLGPCSEIAPPIPYSHIGKHLKSASVLLITSWASEKSRGILTRKLMDAISVQKPVIMFVHGSSDPFLEEFFRRFQPGLLIFSENKDRQNEIGIFLRRKYTEWKQSGEVKNKELTNTKELGWTHQLNSLLKIIEKNTFD